eukprot:685549_1
MAFNVRRRKRDEILASNTHPFKIPSINSNETLDNVQRFTLGLLWLLMIYVQIYCVMPLITRGIIFSSSTLEQCKIMNYTSTDCTYDCDCKYRVDPNGEHQKFCKQCDGKQYAYTAIAESKCGSNVLLTQTKREYVCPETPFETHHIINCYIPQCNYQTFTLHHHFKLILEALVLSFICLAIIIWIPYHLFIQNQRKSVGKIN